MRSPSPQMTDPRLWDVPCPRCDQPLATETDEDTGIRFRVCRNPKCHKTEDESDAD